jgi:hypothetical protein
LALRYKLDSTIDVLLSKRHLHDLRCSRRFTNALHITREVLEVRGSQFYLLPLSCSRFDLENRDDSVIAEARVEIEVWRVAREETNSCLGGLTVLLQQVMTNPDEAKTGAFTKVICSASRLDD